MKDSLTELVRTPKLATYQVRQYRGVYSIREISDLLEVSRPTLYTRLKKHNWTMAELERVDKHFPELTTA